MLLDDLRGVFFLELDVEGAVGVDDHHRPQLAGAHAAGLHDVDLFAQAVLLYFFQQFLLEFMAVGGDAGTAAADQHVQPFVHDALAIIP